MAPREGSARLCNRNRGGDRDGTDMKIARAIRRRRRRRDRGGVKSGAREGYLIAGPSKQQSLDSQSRRSTRAIVHTKRNKTRAKLVVDSWNHGCETRGGS